MIQFFHRLGIVPKRHLQRTLNALNSYHPRIQFTKEEEEMDKIPYLDLLIIRDTDGSLITDWYRKSTASEGTLCYFSSHPEHQKLNVAFNLFYRALKLSHKQFHRQNIAKCFDILLKNKYPLKIIRRQMHKAANRIQSDESNINNINNNINTAATADTADTATTIATTQNTEKEKIIRRSIVYIPGVSDVIAKTINTSVDNLQISHRPNEQLRSTVFSQLKSKRKIGDKTNVIYHFQCEHCGLSYVGQTKNRLHERLCQHSRDIQFTANTDKSGKTAVVHHFEQTGHTPNLKDVRILDVESRLSKRLTLEGLHIYTQPTYNLRCDTDNISSSYCALLQSHGIGTRTKTPT